jgi:uracil-DNA glycosylase family 4
MGIDVWKEKLAQAPPLLFSGCGSLKSKVIFLMENSTPSKKETVGELFNKMLTSINLSRETVYIITFLKPRDEVLDLLKQKIQTLQPKVLMVMGDAAKNLLSNQTEFESIPVILTHHPEHLLSSPQDKKSAYQDLLSLQQKMG